MSMYRQLWLALILSTLLALIGGLLASTFAARAYLQDQLRMKNADNATSLALSLSQRNIGIVDVELAVAALFDSGHYESVRVVDPAGKLLIERVAPKGKNVAPEWFINMMPIAAPPGEAKISSGWKQIGTVSLASHSRFAHTVLWKSAWEMVSALLFAGLVGGYLGTLILRRLKQPLNSVIEQANAISERRFITIPEPKVPELRQLSAAMNSTVLRLKTMFDEAALRLETVRLEVNHDPLTGLANRNHFMARLRATLETEDTPEGSLLLVRVANLADINRRIGRDATDNLLKVFGTTLSVCAGQFPEGLAGRLNGADFALLLPAHGTPLPVANQLLHTLVQNSSVLIGNEPIAHIGAGSFRFGVELGALMSQVDAALASAEAGGTNGASEAALLELDNAPRSAEQWLATIQKALDQRWVRLASFPVTGFAGQLVHRECPLRLKFGPDAEWLPAGRFLPIAERLGIAHALDLRAIELGLEEVRANQAQAGLAINLSARSLQNENFRKQVRARLMANPDASRRLWLEVSEHGALAHFDAFRSFCKDLSGTGCKLGIEHFGRQFSEVGRLHDLGLDYLKVDTSFVRGIEDNAGNQVFLQGLTSIAHNIGLQVFAEGVASDAEVAALGKLGFDGATGPAIRDV